MCRQSAPVCLVKSPSSRQRKLPGMDVRLRALPDPRDRRGRRHGLVSVLLTAACAVLAKRSRRVSQVIRRPGAGRSSTTVGIGSSSCS